MLLLICPSSPKQSEMPSRILYTGVQWEDIKIRPELTSGLFCCFVALHKFQLSGWHLIRLVGPPYDIVGEWVCPKQQRRAEAK